jgi:hypothetical protein
MKAAVYSRYGEYSTCVFAGWTRDYAYSVPLIQVFDALIVFISSKAASMSPNFTLSG